MPEDPITLSLRNVGSSVTIDLSRHPVYGDEISSIAAAIRPRIRNFIFSHVPRTGGSVFLRMLEEWLDPGRTVDTFPVEERNVYNNLAAFVSQTNKTNARFVHVHVPYPVHQVIEGEWPYVTMIRDPVARVISQYKNQKMMTEAGRYSFLGGANGSIADYVKTNPQYTSNLQARHILNLEKFTIDVAGTCAQLIDDDVATALHKCLQIINDRVVFIGVTELWSASVLALALASGRTDVPLMYDFLTSDWPYEVTDEDRVAIAEANAVDIALYDVARREFETRHASVISFLRRNEVPDFHLRNLSNPAFAPLRALTTS